MAAREIKDIEAEPSTGEPAKVVSVERLPNAPLVDVHYPEATYLTQIVRDVSEWSGECFAMDPDVNAKLQIFAPRKMEQESALDLFYASLSIVGLRAVRVGPVTKIVPVKGKIGA